MSRYTTQVSDEIDNYLALNFSAEDKFLAGLREQALALEMPDISISGIQGAFMSFLLKSINARYVLEIGSLAGYSAITMARVLPDDGKLMAIEINPEYAAFIDKKVFEAGLSRKISVINADAAVFLKDYQPGFLLDFIFIDADKQSYPLYLNLCTPLLKIGGIIAFDNALAFGCIASDEHDKTISEIEGIRQLNKLLSEHPQYMSTLATVGDGISMGVKLY